MEEFSTYVFEENEVRTHNAKIVKERVYYIGVLVFIAGFTLALLDIMAGWFFVISGIITFLIGKVVMSGLDTSIGYRSLPIRISRNSVTLGKETFELKNADDIQINIIGYKGQIMIQRIALYKTHSGNDNLMKVRYNNRESEFILDSETHKDNLVEFCETNGFQMKYGVKIE